MRIMRITVFWVRLRTRKNSGAPVLTIYTDDRNNARNLFRIWLLRMLSSAAAGGSCQPAIAWAAVFCHAAAVAVAVVRRDVICHFNVLTPEPPSCWSPAAS